ncbi:MAG: protein kinase [bacterium]
MIGSRIGHYQIEAKIGEGGMGVVYKAKDTRLLRSVAIKILPQHLVVDEKNRQRFIHEARTASALNHPNICTVHDIGQIESIHFIVMEFIEGETLRDILQQRGSLSEKEAAAISRQVCSALSAAHDKEIIHCDIKPDNIIRTKDGQVKVMDFGLAKLTTAQTRLDAKSHAMPESALPLDQFQSSVSSLEGTALYMAPEQIERAPVDARTDIYALGVVLFELLTGNPPFKGEDSLSLMTAILDEEPPALSKAKPGISRAMEAIVLKTLAKSPDERFQSIDELDTKLKQIASPPVKLTKKKLAVWISSLMIAFILVVFSLKSFWLKNGDNRRLPELKIEGLSLTTDSDASAVFSPNSRKIAYISTKSDSNGFTQSLKIKELKSGQTKTIYAKSQYDAKPLLATLDWSPEGRWIATAMTRGGICLVDTSENHKIVKLADFGHTPRWSPGGQKIAFSSLSPFLVWENNAIWLYDFADSSLRKISPENRLSYDSPAWSPDSRWIVCLGGVGSEKALWTLNVDTGQMKKLLQLESAIESPIWSSTGHFIYFKSEVNGTTGLFRVRVDLRSAKLTSEPELVISDTKFGRFNLSPDGKKLIYQTGKMQEELWRIPFKSSFKNLWQKAELLTTHTNFTTNIAISPDGKTLALETLTKGVRTLVLYYLERGDQKLLYNNQNAYAPAWSPDGRWIAFDAGGGNNADIWQISVAGGRAEKIIDHPGADWMPTYSPDGREICFLSNRNGPFDLWSVSTSDGKTHQITNTPGTESGGYGSHNGKGLAYFRNSASENSSGVWIYDVSAKTEKEIYRFENRKLDILTKILWSADDSILYFYDERGFAKLVIAESELSYPLAMDEYPYKYIRYALHDDQLYLIKRKFDSESIWMAEGLE